MMKNKQYVLLRDTPELKAGAIFKYRECDGRYGFDMGNTNINFTTYSKHVVETDSEWFELIQDFKVGDIVYYNALNCLVKITELKDGIYYWSNGNLPVNSIRKATNDELSYYYKQEGWVKGANCLKSYDPEPHHPMNRRVDKYKVVDLVIINNSVWVECKHAHEPSNFNQAEDCTFPIKECKLIKEPDYPKSWEELKSTDGYFIDSNAIVFNTGSYGKNHYATRNQAISAIAFAQLSQLHKAIVGDWVPNFSLTDNTNKYVIERLGNDLVINIYSAAYHPLPFKTLEQCEFSLKYHTSLWSQYFQID